MVDRLLIVRVRTDLGFADTREQLRDAITNGLTAWGAGGVRLTSISPLPVDRYIKPRKPPVRRDYPLLSYLEKP